MVWVTMRVRLRIAAMLDLFGMSYGTYLMTVAGGALSGSATT